MWNQVVYQLESDDFLVNVILGKNNLSSLFDVWNASYSKHWLLMYFKINVLLTGVKRFFFYNV